VSETRFGVGDSSSVTHSFSTSEVDTVDPNLSERVTPDGVTFVSTFQDVPAISDKSDICVAISVDYTGTSADFTYTTDTITIDAGTLGRIDFKARDKIDCVDTTATLKIICRAVTNPVQLRAGTNIRRICYLCPIPTDNTRQCYSFAIDPEVFITYDNTTTPSTQSGSTTQSGSDTSPSSITQTVTTTTNTQTGTATANTQTGTNNQPTPPDSSNSFSVVVSILLLGFVFF